MAKTIFGDVASWGSSPSLENYLIATGMSPYAVSISQTTSTADATAFAASGVEYSAMAPGIRSWSGSMSGRHKLAGGIAGHGSAVATLTGSSSNGFPTATVYGYTLSMTAPAYDSTSLSTSGVRDSEFTPGFWSWSVTMQAWIDDAAALVNTDAGVDWVGTPAAVSLKTSEDGVTDNTIGGACIITGYEYGNSIGSLGTANITLQGTAGLAIVGSDNIMPAGIATALIAPTTGELIVHHSSAATKLIATGDAFLTALSLSVPGPGALLDVSASFQGTGALVHTRA